MPRPGFFRGFRTGALPEGAPVQLVEDPDVLDITGNPFWGTFQQWSDRRYRIRKGCRSRARNANGEPLFSQDQVWNWQEVYTQARPNRGLRGSRHCWEDPDTIYAFDEDSEWCFDVDPEY